MIGVGVCPLSAVGCTYVIYISRVKPAPGNHACGVFGVSSVLEGLSGMVYSP